ncbi:MAG: GGDEF domain-containing protein [Candidatus Omnitrophota bacterium]
MTLNEYKKRKPAVEFPVCNPYRFILNLQTKNDVRQALKTFVYGVSPWITIQCARLIYRVGATLESLNLTKNGLTLKSLPEYLFIEFPDECDYKTVNQTLVFFKRFDGDCIQLEIDGVEPVSDTLNALPELTQIFLNHLILLLRIKNFEYTSFKDDITLAYNQNYLKAFIRNEIERSRRFASVFAIVFFDLDNLKVINDQHGHLIGTEILKEVSAILRKHVRKVDMLSRFGGDEFVIVLLHADAPKAFEVCLRIRKALNDYEFLKNQNLSIKTTGSFGISSFPEDGQSVEELIRKADRAMYDVKRTGKDGIKIYVGDY